jgi:hypothetical protein
VSGVEVPRARRVSLTVPISYRPLDSDQWVQSRVVNISESGVLLAATDVQPGRGVELIFSMPVPIESLPVGKMICIGQVVRTTPAGATAVRFSECRFLLET